MSYQNIEVLVLTVDRATESVTANQLVGFDGGPCGADEQVYGVAKTNADVGEPFAVIVKGVVELVAGSSIATGDRIYSDASGKVTATGSNYPAGHAITGGAAGDRVEILIR